MDIIRQINWVDILAVILVLRISYASAQEGLSHGIFPLIGNAVIIILGLRYYTTVGGLITRYLFNMPAALANFLGFLGLVVALELLCKVLDKLLVNIIKTEWHSAIERWGGCLVGVLKACVITCIVITILALAPLPYLQMSIRNRSLMGMRILKIGPAMYSKVSGFLPAVLGGSAALSQEALVNELASDKKLVRGVKK